MLIGLRGFAQALGNFLVLGSEVSPEFLVLNLLGFDSFAFILVRSVVSATRSFVDL